jgi:pantetheine-phosphate adenylyltransferase
MEKSQTKEKIAVYPGSFDPVTFGHLDVIKRSLKIFDRVVVAVLKNDSKKPLFTLEERVALIRESLKDVKNVEVDSFSGLLVNYMKKKNAFFIVRGLRAMSDFDYEFQMAVANKDMQKETETIFIVTDKKYFYLNSRLVKELALFGGSLSELVPKNVEASLRKKFGK